VTIFLSVLGQKFVMLEMKSTISQVLRSFMVIESDSKEDLRFTLDFVLKIATGLKVKLQLRQALKISPERLSHFNNIPTI
jgi:hypothetical protein